MPVSQGNTSSVCSTIKSIEQNTQLTTANNGGKAINNLPAERGKGGGHFDSMGKGK